MASKLKTIRHHFKSRLTERIGIVLTDHIMQSLLSQIYNGSSEVIYRESLTKSCHKVNYNDIEFAVIYSKKYKTFITAFPLEWAYERREIIV